MIFLDVPDREFYKNHGNFLQKLLEHLFRERRYVSIFCRDLPLQLAYFINGLITVAPFRERNVSFQPQGE
jgi:hypothetical protein